MEETEVVTGQQEVIDTGVSDVEEGKTEEQKALETLDEHKDVEITNEGQKEKVATDDKKEEDTDKKPEDKTASVEQDVKGQLKAQEDIKADLQTKGVDFDALANEYEENGSLSEASMKALAGAGYPKSAVDAFIRGWEATVQSYTNAVFDMAGGEKAYGQMCQFIMGQGQPEVDSFNAALERGDLTQLKVMMDGYKARMTTKYGTSNRSVLGGNASAPQGGFNSKEAMIKAMSDSRYGTDTAYTEKVQRMTAQSSFIG